MLTANTLHSLPENGVSSRTVAPKYKIMHLNRRRHRRWKKEHRPFWRPPLTTFAPGRATTDRPCLLVVLVPASSAVQTIRKRPRHVYHRQCMFKERLYWQPLCFVRRLIFFQLRRILRQRLKIEAARNGQHPSRCSHAVLGSFSRENDAMHATRRWRGGGSRECFRLTDQSYVGKRQSAKRDKTHCSMTRPKPRYRHKCVCMSPGEDRTCVAFPASPH